MVFSFSCEDCLVDSQRIRTPSLLFARVPPRRPSRYLASCSTGNRAC